MDGYKLCAAFNLRHTGKSGFHPGLSSADDLARLGNTVLFAQRCGRLDIVHACDDDYLVDHGATLKCEQCSGQNRHTPELHHHLVRPHALCAAGSNDDDGADRLFFLLPE